MNLTMQEAILLVDYEVYRLKFLVRHYKDELIGVAIFSVAAGYFLALGYLHG